MNTRHNSSAHGPGPRVEPRAGRLGLVIDSSSNQPPFSLPPGVQRNTPYPEASDLRYLHHPEAHSTFEAQDWFAGFVFLHFPALHHPEAHSTFEAQDWFAGFVFLHFPELHHPEAHSTFEAQDWFAGFVFLHFPELHHPEAHSTFEAQDWFAGFVFLHFPELHHPEAHSTFEAQDWFAGFVFLHEATKEASSTDSLVSKADNNATSSTSSSIRAVVEGVRVVGDVSVVSDVPTQAARITNRTATIRLLEVSLTMADANLTLRCSAHQASRLSMSAGEFVGGSRRGGPAQGCGHGSS